MSPCRLANLGLFVQRVAATTRTELLDLELLRLLLLVPGGHIVAPLAAVARQSDQFPDCCHDCFLSSLAPRLRRARARFKAHGGNRTRDLFLTKEVLYRLSYMGKPAIQKTFGPSRLGLERETGLEPATPSLEGSRSTN